MVIRSLMIKMLITVVFKFGKMLTKMVFLKKKSYAAYHKQG